MGLLQPDRRPESDQRAFDGLGGVLCRRPHHRHQPTFGSQRAPTRD